MILHRHFFQQPTTQAWILKHGVREDIIEWLVWNDRNGIYSDEACEVEGVDKLTLESARELMKQFVSNRLPLDQN